MELPQHAQNWACRTGRSKPDPDGLTGAKLLRGRGCPSSRKVGGQDTRTRWPKPICENFCFRIVPIQSLTALLIRLTAKDRAKQNKNSKGRCFGSLQGELQARCSAKKWQSIKERECQQLKCTDELRAPGDKTSEQSGAAGGSLERQTMRPAHWELGGWKE